MWTVVAQTTATTDWVLVDLGTVPDLFPLLWFFYEVASMASKNEELETNLYRHGT